MTSRASEVPRAALTLVVIWSWFELLACYFSLDSYVILVQLGPTEDFLTPFCLIGLFASWLFIATWFLIGARPSPRSEESTPGRRPLRQRVQWLRAGLLAMVVVQVVLFNRTLNGQWCLGLFIAGAIPGLAWLTIYRQITGRRIAKSAPQLGDSLSIFGIMLLTGIIALGISLCRSVMKLELETLTLAFAIGATLGLIWTSVMLWMLHRSILWFILSLFLLFPPIMIATKSMLNSPLQGVDLVNDSIVAVASLYLHAVVYFGALRAADYRLKV